MLFHVDFELSYSSAKRLHASVLRILAIRAKWFLSNVCLKL